MSVTPQIYDLEFQGRGLPERPIARKLLALRSSAEEENFGEKAGMHLQTRTSFEATP